MIRNVILAASVAMELVLKTARQVRFAAASDVVH